jgi:hypothetical protein
VGSSEHAMTGMGNTSASSRKPNAKQVRMKPGSGRGS